MKKFIYIIFLTSFFLNAQTPAFKGAKGAGAFSRECFNSPYLMFVTSLNSTGSGSLRAALTATGNRIIIPRVGGIIDLGGNDIEISNPASGGFYFAGQAAPDGGLTVIGGRVYLYADVDNIIWRYMRIKGGYDAGSNRDSFSSQGTNNSIFDHISFGAGSDEAGSWVTDTVGGTIDNLTIQYCIFSESKTGSIVGAHNVGWPNATGDISILNNLYYNISHRFPNIQGYGNFEIINNIAWGWRNRITAAYGGLTVSKINNYNYFSTLNTFNSMLSQGERYGYDSSYSPSIWSEGNIYSPLSTTVPPSEQFTGIWGVYDTNDPGGHPDNSQVPIEFKAASRPALLGNPVTILTANEALADVSNRGNNARLDESGNIVSNLSTLDAEYIFNVENGIYVAPRDETDWDVPSFTGGTPYVDTDNDGMPDVWETTFYGDLSKTWNGDEDSDGRLNIEDFLDLIDGVPSTPPIQNEGIIINSRKIRVNGKRVKILIGT